MRHGAAERSSLLLAAICLVLLLGGQFERAGASAAGSRRNTFTRSQTPASWHSEIHLPAGASGGVRVHERNGAVAPAFAVHSPVMSVPFQPHRAVHPAGRHLHATAPAAHLHRLPPMMLPSPGLLSTLQPTSTLAPLAPSGDLSARSSGNSTNSNNNVRLEAPKVVNMSEVCGQLVSSTEKQLMSYVNGFEAITGTMHELDEMMQQMRASSCEARPVPLVSNTSVSPQPFNATESVHFNAPEELGRAEATPGVDRVALVPISAPAFEPSAIEGSTENSSLLALSTTESFADPEPSGRLNSSSSSGDSNWSGAGRSERDTARRVDGPTNTSPFGLPIESSPAAGAARDQISEELSRASSDLKALRKDLSRTAEWLKQTNHTVHSALLRALLTYVTSIERRIDTERQAYAAQARSEFVRSRIAIIREKIAALLDKLRSLIPSRILPINREDSTVAANAAVVGIRGRSTTPLPNLNLPTGSSTSTTSSNSSSVSSS